MVINPLAKIKETYTYNMRLVLLFAFLASTFSFLLAPPFSSQLRLEACRKRHFPMYCESEGMHDGNGIEAPVDEELKKEALELLDCLTSPKSNEDPLYDVEKDVRRDELLAQNDYQELKVQLRARGLRTTGDKLEMITRLLFHIVDPTMKLNQMTGREPNLQYVTEEDLKSGDVQLVPEDKRHKNNGDGLDAEDMLVLNRNDEDDSKMMPLKGSTRLRKKKPTKKSSTDLTIMDGLERRITSFPIPEKLSDDIENMKKETSKGSNFLDAYVVGGRDVLRTWEKNRSPTVILLPDEKGWKSKNVRIMADEISFTNQVIVIVPSIELTKDESVGFISLEDGVKNINRDGGKRALSDELLNEVVAAVRYAHVQFDSQVITFSGIGIGGGLALEAAAELSTLNVCNNMYMNIPPGGVELPKRTLEISIPAADEPTSVENWNSKSDENDAFMKLLEDENEKGAYPRQVGAGFIVGTEGLDAPLESDILVDSDIGVEDVEQLLSSSSEIRGADDFERLTDSTPNEAEDIQQQCADGVRDIVDTGKGSILNPEPIDADTYLRTAMESFGFNSKYQNTKEKARLAGLIKACAVFSPCNYNLPLVGENIRIPTFLAFGEGGRSEGSRLVDARAIQELLSARKINHSIRVYRGRKENFIEEAVVATVGDPAGDIDNDDNQKCCQEALAIASIWLELFSRDMLEDPTDGVFDYRYINDDSSLQKTVDEIDTSLSFSMISPDDLMPPRSSAVAKHVHDDPKLF